MRKLIFFFIVLTNAAICQITSVNATQPLYQKTEPSQSIKIDTSLFKMDSTLKHLLRFSPRDYQFHVQRGQILFDAAKFDSAETAYKIALALCDTIPEIYNRLGFIEFQKSDRKIIPFEKLLRLIKRDRKSKAMRYFEKALDLNPDYIDAHYNLGRTYLAKSGKKDLQKAEKHFNFILKQLFKYKDTIYQLGRVYQIRKENTTAIEIFKGLAQSREADGRESIQLANIYYEIHQMELASRAYYSGLKLLKNSEMLEDMYQSIRMLLTDDEKKDYRQLPDSGKALFFKKFWTHRDPTPGTDLNERLIEHFRRVDFARLSFRYTAPPYYDDRGRIYIKYGQPDERFSTPAENTFAKSNESWSYEHLQEGLVFDFVADGAIFRLVQDLREAALAGTPYDARMSVAASLYQQRSHVSNTYARLAMRVDESQLTQFQSTRIEALTEASPEIFIVDVDAKPLPAIYKWSQFKGTQDSTSVFFYFALQAKVFNFKKDQNKNKFKTYLDYTIVTYNQAYDPVYQYQLTAPLIMPTLKNVEHGNFIFKNQFNISPADYELQLMVKSKQPKRMGVYKNILPVRNFSSDELEISDLLLATSVEPVGQDSIGQFIRDGLKIIPHPFYSVIQKNPIHIYYEVYNLSYDPKGQTRYQLQYTAQTTKAKRSLLASTFGFIGKIFSRESVSSITSSYTRTGTKSQATEYIAFDLQNLKLGITQLTVRVIDLNLNKSVVDTVEFDLIQ